MCYVFLLAILLRRSDFLFFSLFMSEFDQKSILHVDFSMKKIEPLNRVNAYVKWAKEVSVPTLKQVLWFWQELRLVFFLQFGVTFILSFSLPKNTKVILYFLLKKKAKKAIACFHCEEMFSTQKTLKTHLLNCHGETDEDSTSLKTPHLSSFES